MNILKAVNKDDLQMLNGLLVSDTSAIQKIYNDSLPSIILSIKNMNGSEEDARDVFQEALIALFNRIRSQDFELTCKLSSYLKVICKNLFYKKLRDNKNTIELTTEEKEISLDKTILDELLTAERTKLFYSYLNQLDEKCFKILKAFFNKTPLKEIANSLNTSEGYIKKRKFLCKEKLIKNIKEDTRFNELKL